LAGHLLIVLGAPQTLGDLLTKAFASTPDVRLVVKSDAPSDPRAAALRLLAVEPGATIVVLEPDASTGTVWQLEERALAPVSLNGLVDALRRR
jgi:hypothetical protein